MGKPGSTIWATWAFAQGPLSREGPIAIGWVGSCSHLKRTEPKPTWKWTKTTCTVFHSLKVFCTVSSGVSNFPEFVLVVMMDELQIGYYDSNNQTAEPKQAWMDQLARDYPELQEMETKRGLDTQQRYKARIDDVKKHFNQTGGKFISNCGLSPNYLEEDTGHFLGSQQSFKADIETLKKHFNQTGGVHIYQVMFGCEWDDEDDTTDGYEQHGYDGEDFIALDLKTWTWIAAVQQAFYFKQRWDQDRAELQYLKNYLTKECVGGLKTFLAYGKSTLQRTGRVT
ncbi:Major histocompatibility complex class I-related gene protein [Merluccius polli]|uniref:Major histocompatibility complex class I-related gene protein n=1 Tax=Merluccius polli TaxID=89951 RepID=A0AA47P4Y8_MERPO|nr:Major histocompatibility complex class I-related gene protein [Merluccius polli]